MSDAVAVYELPDPYDGFLSTRLLRSGGNDPTFKRLQDGFVRASRYGVHPSTLEVRWARHEVRCRAWGEGAEPAICAVPDLLGLQTGPFAPPAHPVVDRWVRAHRGLRQTSTHQVFEALVVTVLQQLVTWQEAVAAWGNLVRLVGEVAPGPHGLWMPPSPCQIRQLSLAEIVCTGTSRKRAETLRRCAERARRMEEADSMETPDAMRRLMALQGIGPWTAASVLGHRLGRPDVLLQGDFHFPHTMAYALTGAHRGSEDELVALMEPFRGHEFELLLLVYAEGIQAPRRGPRKALRFGR